MAYTQAFSRLAAVLVAGGLLAVILVHEFSSVSVGPTTAKIDDLSSTKRVRAQMIARDDWKQPSLDLDTQLTATLAEAPPLTGEERAQVYKVIVNFAVSEKRKEEPETLMSARVGTIGFATDGSRQVLVQGVRRQRAVFLNRRNPWRELVWVQERAT